MGWRIQEEPVTCLAQQALIPSSFRVSRRLEVALIEGGLGGVTLRERNVECPFVKDYDAIEGDGPTSWAERLDVSNWGLLGAFAGRNRVGGAVLAFDTDGLEMLRGRRDLTVVWDIRVHPEHRRRGLGRALFEAAERWARSRNCRALCVETQNINVAACRFYASQKCALGSINRFAYPELPEEVQLIWYKDLTEGAACK
jgi:GNAT superfamily N-acetyltransferase